MNKLLKLFFEIRKVIYKIKVKNKMRKYFVMFVFFFLIVLGKKFFIKRLF